MKKRLDAVKQEESEALDLIREIPTAIKMQAFNLFDFMLKSNNTIEYYLLSTKMYDVAMTLSHDYLGFDPFAKIPRYIFTREIVRVAYVNKLVKYSADSMILTVTYIYTILSLSLSTSPVARLRISRSRSTSLLT